MGFALQQQTKAEDAEMAAESAKDKPDPPPIPAANAHGDFASLYDRFYPRIFRYAMRVLMNRTLAEDIAGETFTRALEHFASHNPQTVSAWLYRIATNLIHDHWRRGWRVTYVDPTGDGAEALLDRPASGEGAADRLERLERWRELHRQISRLKPEYRTVIVLYYFEEMGLSEIARVLGVLAPTVRWRLHRARRRLADLLNRPERSER